MLHMPGVETHHVSPAHLQEVTRAEQLYDVHVATLCTPTSGLWTTGREGVVVRFFAERVEAGWHEYVSASLFFEVWLDDSDEQDEYVISPERYVRFERGCQRFVVYTYDGSELYAEEEIPLCEEEGYYYCGNGSLHDESANLACTAVGADVTRTEMADDQSNDVGGAPTFDENDAAANVRFACWLGGVGEVELLEHMAGLGFPLFDVSLEAGLGASPLAAIREVGRYVGCPLEVLLSMDDKFFRWLIGIVCNSDEWDLYPRSPDLGARQSTPSRLLFAFDGNGRVLALGADYADWGFPGARG